MTDNRPPMTQNEDTMPHKTTREAAHEFMRAQNQALRALNPADRAVGTSPGALNRHTLHALRTRGLVTDDGHDLTDAGLAVAEKLRADNAR